MHGVPARGAFVPEDIWATQAVDANGVGTNPYVGSASDGISVTGIALNNSDDLLPPNLMFQVYVQGEGSDAGGIAAWAGSFYYQGGPGSNPWLAEYDRLTPDANYPTTPWQAGDRIRVEGYIANHNGKTNINERHTSDPGMDFSIYLVEAGVGLPEPVAIPSISTCASFDSAGDADPLLAHRHTGGELYQGQLCKLEGVELLSGVWAAGQTVVVTDDGGSSQLNLLLSAMGNFTSAPAGLFDVVGIFDQEDTASPYTGDYRLWVTGQDSVSQIPEPTAAACLLAGTLALACRRRR
jgi:hypothetical protein